MLGIVEESALYKIESDFTCWFGEMHVGDVVVDVQKLEPISPGSKIFLKADWIFPVFAEDIRMINIELDTRVGERTQRVRARLDTIMYQ